MPLRLGLSALMTHSAYVRELFASEMRRIRAAPVGSVIVHFWRASRVQNIASPRLVDTNAQADRRAVGSRDG
jgi:hypothetical protein